MHLGHTLLVIIIESPYKMRHLPAMASRLRFFICQSISWRRRMLRVTVPVIGQRMLIAMEHDHFMGKSCVNEQLSVAIVGLVLEGLLGFFSGFVQDFMGSCWVTMGFHGNL